MVYRGLPLSSYVASLRQRLAEERPIVIRAIGSFGCRCGLRLSAIDRRPFRPFGKGSRSCRRCAGAGGPTQLACGDSSAGQGTLRSRAGSARPGRDCPRIHGQQGGTGRARADTCFERSSGLCARPGGGCLGSHWAEGRRSRCASRARIARVRIKASFWTSVAYALGDIGPAAKDALPALQQVLEQRRLGSAAQEAILKIQGSRFRNITIDPLIKGG